MIGSTEERGAATLIALALSAFVIMAALVAADLGALAVARAQAQTAADLAALAALTPSGGPGDTAADGSGRPGSPAADGAGGPSLGGPSAVDRAAGVATANGAHMTQCACEPMEALVSVRRRMLLAPFGVPVEVNAYARAVLPGPGMAALPRRSPTGTRRPPPFRTVSANT